MVCILLNKSISHDLYIHMSNTGAQETELDIFLEQHRLSQDYIQTATRYFDPVVESLCLALYNKTKNRPVFVGLCGAQGAGKSTLAEYICLQLETRGHKVLVLSLDDFYFGKAERAKLAQTVHPLLKTRGVPGTHDIKLLSNTLEILRNSTAATVSLAKFDKASDDRVAPLCIPAKNYDLVIFEGWCWGARHAPKQTLRHPCNSFEQRNDKDAVWRTYVNEALVNNYEPLYALFDHWLFLRAPSFDCVYRWRLEQEQKMQAALNHSSKNGGMSSGEILEFIQHYQRITEQLLNTAPEYSDVVWQLAQTRKVARLTISGSLAKAGG